MKIIKRIYFKPESALSENSVDEVGVVNTGVFEGCPVRMAARAILRDLEGNVALMQICGGKNHKIPGGGVDSDEEILTALRREVREEVGAEIKVVNELGAVVQYGDNDIPFQVSFCYLCDVVGIPQKPQLTSDEIDQQYKLLWVSLHEAKRLIESENHDDNRNEEMVRERELAFLENVVLNARG